MFLRERFSHASVRRSEAGPQRSAPREGSGASSSPATGSRTHARSPIPEPPIDLSPPRDQAYGASKFRLRRDRSARRSNERTRDGGAYAVWATTTDSVPGRGSSGGECKRSDRRPPGPRRSSAQCAPRSSGNGQRGLSANDSSVIALLRTRRHAASLQSRNSAYRRRSKLPTREAFALG